MKSMLKQFLCLTLGVTLLCSTAWSASIEVEARSQMVGNMNMSGDSTFDCDIISDNTKGQPRWLSYPGTRMTLNPNDQSYAGAMANNLPLALGGFVGTNSIKLQNVCEVKIAPRSGVAEQANSVNTTWYPHKITFNASYRNLATTNINGYDFFVDNKDTVMRVLEVNGSDEIDLQLKGNLDNASAQWLSDDKVILVNSSKYYYALKIVGLDSSNTPFELEQVPTVNSSNWEMTIPCDIELSKIAIIFGFAAKGAETSDDAVKRAKNCMNQTVTQILNDTKTYYNSLLQKAPKPTKWGINYVSADGITPQQHKLKYYEAWTFMLANYVRDIPEDDYNYAQVLCGKPSLWDCGHSSSPGTCAWESFFGYQYLGYILPDEAWSAYEGIMSHIDANGELPGECLPSRKAQTAWYLYSMTQDISKLENVYPAIKRYLEWREQNPRWIWSNMSISDEKDMEFVVSWLRDVDYAIKICDILGESNDKEMWITKKNTMINQMQNWFVTPSKIYQYWFTNKSSHYYWYRNEDLPHMISTALDIRGLPTDLMERFKEYYLSYHDDSKAMCGFDKQKFPDSDFVFYGLLENKMYQEFKEYVNINLRECIKVSPFAERIKVINNTSEIEGVIPSLFTACTVITTTFLTNDVRVDSGEPEEIVFENVPAKPTNLALNKVTTCSAIEPQTSFTSEKAVDNKLSTRWASDYNDAQWLSVDLEQEYEINKVVLNWEEAFGKAYKIQVSNDGIKWTDIYTTSSSNGGRDEIIFKQTQARYVRMYGVKRASSWGYSLYEFEVYGK